MAEGCRMFLRALGVGGKHSAGAKLRAGVVVLSMLLGACGPTPFQPADRGGSNGYTVERLEQDHFRIGFSGSSTTSAQQVADNLAYLAAQVTLRNGADYYVVESDKMERATVYDPLGSRGPVEYFHCCHPNGVTSHEYEGKADIVIHRGPTPQNDPAAHDAREVVEQLAPRIRRGDRYGVY
jgi:hypothetical protein